MNKANNILWGVGLIILGVILGLNALNITDINIFFDGWWTLIIIIPSVFGLFTDKHKMSNVICLLIGVALLLCAQDIISFSLVWKLALPVILLLIGISIIFKDTITNKVSEEIKKINEKNKDNKDNEYCSTFSSQHLKFDGEKFTGATATAVFGSVDLDLRKAVIKDKQVINCSAIFGSVDIYVPENIKVIVKSNSIFGGVTNRIKTTDEKTKTTIYINATCMFGGVEIK